MDIYNEIRRVLMNVLFGNIFITIVKIILGLYTGSLAIISDGFHSLIDSSSNVIGLIAIKIAKKPADNRFPYGYYKYETLGAFAIGGIMLIAVWEILQGVIERLSTNIQPEISKLTLILMALTFPINLLIVYLETKAGKKINSEILLADAAHTKTDLFVTISVIISMVGVYLGWEWIDSITAIIVILFIIRAALNILKDTSYVLADKMSIEPNLITDIANSIAGVKFVHNVRSRGTNNAQFVDLHIRVDPKMTVQDAHNLATKVENKIISSIDKVLDAMVHIEPIKEK